MRKSWRNTSLLLFGLTLVAGGIYGSRIQALTDEARSSLRLYTELVTAAHENYGADVNYRDLVYASINGMVRTLDPHTNFLPPQAYTGMRERQQSSFYGLGILVSMRSGRVTVITPIEGGPASRLGIQAGDIIDTIDGESTEGLVLDEAVGKLKGPKGTEVTITILRHNLEKPLEFTVARAEIPLTTVRYSYMLTPDTGYMRITDFNRGTAKEVADSIHQLREQGMKRLLLDLRNNGGGLLDQAIEVSDQFVPEGTKIVETRGRTRSSQQAFFAGEQYDELDMPLVVLVNTGTASAAEILAGAIQDHDVGVIAGTPTWGKGLVQTVYSLSYGAGLALTTARYYTPSGRLIQRDYSSYYDYYSYDGQPQQTADTDEAQPEAPPAITTEDLEVQGEAKTPEADPRQTFTTDLGRKVYAGGGIAPDVTVELDPLTPFAQHLLTYNAFFDFGVEYQDKHPVHSEQWQPDGKVLESFKQWLVEKKINTADELAEGFADAGNREYALRQIHAEVFNAVYGQNAWHRVLAQGDAQIQEGLDLFDRAAKLLARRDALRQEQLAEQKPQQQP